MRTINTQFNQVSDLNEIIFAHRNQAYGAYELRKHYNERLLKAFAIAIGSTILLLLLNSYMMNHRKPPFVPRPTPPVIVDTLGPIIVEPNKKTQTPPQEPKVVKLIPTKIVNDSMMHVVERKDSILDVALIPGTTGLEGTGSTAGESSSGGGTGGGMMVDTGISTGTGYRQIASVMPSFPGGQKALVRYVQRNFKCSGENISGEGKIFLRFVVMKDGSIFNIEVLKDNVGIDCVEEAKRLLINSPRWNPGSQNNQPVNVQMVLPITIQME